MFPFKSQTLSSWPKLQLKLKVAIHFCKHFSVLAFYFKKIVFTFSCFLFKFEHFPEKYINNKKIFLSKLLLNSHQMPTPRIIFGASVCLLFRIDSIVGYSCQNFRFFVRALRDFVLLRKFWEKQENSKWKFSVKLL